MYNMEYIEIWTCKHYRFKKFNIYFKCYSFVHLFRGQLQFCSITTRVKNEENLSFIMI